MATRQTEQLISVANPAPGTEKKPPDAEVLNANQLSASGYWLKS
jgi:hypothetical protein